MKLSRYKLMSCPMLEKLVLKLFILMLIEAVLSLLYAVIDESKFGSALFAIGKILEHHWKVH